MLFAVLSQVWRQVVPQAGARTRLNGTAAGQRERRSQASAAKGRARFFSGARSECLVLAAVPMSGPGASPT